jgi:TalC/MipB family fructose-6-phosphate aldolase
MELWLDTINVETIRHAADLGILTGVTTNPAVLSRADQSFEMVIESIAINQPGKIAVQVVRHEYDAIMKQARRLANINDRIVVKIPAVRDGFRAIATLERENVNVLATTIFEPRQIILAALCGATYVAPYLNRIQMATGDAFEIIEKSQRIIEKYGFRTKVLSAAVKSVEQFVRCAELGVSAVTLPDDVYHALFAENESIGSSLRKFDLAWDSNAGMNKSPVFTLD